MSDKQHFYVTFVEAHPEQGPLFGMAIVSEPVPQWWDKERKQGKNLIVLSRQPITPEEAEAWIDVMQNSRKK